MNEFNDKLDVNQSMFRDDTKAAPSLADDLAQRIADHDCGCGSVEGFVLTPCSHRENYRSLVDVVLAHPTIIAALRAVEAVRAFSVVRAPGKDEDWDYDKRIFDDGFRAGYRDGVEAVQALLEGE